MMVAASLLSTLLALVVAAYPRSVVQNSHVKLPLVKRISNAGPHSLVKQDQLRIQSLKARAEGLDVLSPRQVNLPADNRAVNYIASVGVGSPATQYDLIIDTGSANTWVGAGKSYIKTSTSQQTANNVSVSYHDLLGDFNGTEFIDQVTIANGLVIPEQSIGVASASTGFSGVDGILGVGPVDLTLGTLSPAKDTSIPTVTDNLFKSGVIGQNILGISFEPLTNSDGEETNGELTWGGIDPVKYTGLLIFSPITTVSPSSTFWGFEASIYYGSITLLPNAPGILDTGTYLVQIASDVFTVYQQATGGVLDSATGLLSITPEQYANLQPFYVTLSSVPFGLTADGQIWPRNLNTLIGGTAGKIYLIVGNSGIQTGLGMDFIFGQTFLERFYSAYDTGNKQVGLATTSFTNATINY